MADKEVRNFLLDSEKRTRKVLKEKKVELQRLAEGLLEYETLTREEIYKVVRGETINKAKTVSNTVVKSTSSGRLEVINEPSPTPVEV